MINEKDFVTIDYVGETGGKAFDTTLEEYGKEMKNKSFKPVTIIVGAGHVIKGLDDTIKGKKVGDHFEVDIKPEQGFGEKQDKLVQLIPLKNFKKQNINPYPGLILNIDGAIGTIKSVSGGRVMIDFNHPLAGRKLHYKVWIKKIIKDKDEKLKKLVEFHTGTEPEIDGNQVIYDKEIPEMIKKKIFEEVKSTLNLTEMRFVQVFRT